MNKGKLRSLMFHAGFCNEDGGWDNRPIFEQEHDNFQRFAELIVRECAEAVENSIWHLPRDYKAVDQAKFVMKQFGVEE